MDAVMYKPVRTKMEPWDWIPGARGPVRTEVRPEDMDPHAIGVRTRVTPEDLNPRVAAVRTTLRAGELEGHAVGAGLPTEKQHQELTKQAERLIAQTFFGALLKQMRNSPFKSELFSGGRGGEAFGSMYDERLAERMAHGAGRRLAASIVKHLEEKRGGK